MFDAIIGAAVARGLNFEIFQNETAKMDGEYGSYANAYQLVRLALADAAAPTGETIRMVCERVKQQKDRAEIVGLDRIAGRVA